VFETLSDFVCFFAPKRLFAKLTVIATVSPLIITMSAMAVTQARRSQGFMCGVPYLIGVWIVA
jgi:hypothetical protein